LLLLLLRAADGLSGVWLGPAAGGRSASFCSR
jgi:hypothetical protein